MKNVLLTLIAMIVFSTCRSPKIQLTDQEKTLQEKLASECKCKVTLFHSWSAVTQKRSDGSFYVEFAFDSSNKPEYCTRSEKWLRIYTQMRVKQLLRVLSHRENYQQLVVGYSVTKKIDEDYAESTCSKDLIYDLNSGRMTYQVIE